MPVTTARKKLFRVSLKLAVKLATLLLLVTGIAWVIFPFDQPWTVAGAVRSLERDLPADTRDWMLRTPKPLALTNMHLSLGMKIRNEFGLWGRNLPLQYSCGKLGADDCSGIILGALWHSVRAKESPALVKAIDEQFQYMENIKIDYQGFHLARIGEIIAQIQDQIDTQLANEAGHHLHITTSGSPNLDGYTRAEFEGNPVPISMYLNWISWRNGFTVRHAPPNIELVFHEPHAWPEPPAEFEVVK
ncbi:DUF6794 domain-containing protein [Verrucomicrobium spinosum]|uniref:DUF6794 domain-containing protein n=1 Tax=Verrucomicrobium spinosum TaxID=2736 RepID=UPI00017468C9|nr:DUF6794 domain-containing protein [Verrucomicrobium spinosum]